MHLLIHIVLLSQSPPPPSYPETIGYDLQYQKYMSVGIDGVNDRCWVNPSDYTVSCTITSSTHWLRAEFRNLVNSFVNNGQGWRTWAVDVDSQGASCAILLQCIRSISN